MKRFILAAVGGAFLFGGGPAFCADEIKDGIAPNWYFVDVYRELTAPETMLLRYTPETIVSGGTFTEEKTLAADLLLATQRELIRYRMRYLFTMKMAYVHPGGGGSRRLEALLSVDVPSARGMESLPFTRIVTGSRWRTDSWMAKEAAQLLVRDLLSALRVRTETAQR